jgi:uncharacterized membrane protein
MTTYTPRRGLPLIVALGLFIVVLGLIAEIIGEFGHQLGAMRYGSYVADFGGVICIPAALLTRPGTGRRGFLLSLVGLLLAIAGLALSLAKP